MCFLYTLGKYENFNIVQAFIDVELVHIIIFMVIGVIAFIPVALILCVQWKYKPIIGASLSESHTMVAEVNLESRIRFMILFYISVLTLMVVFNTIIIAKIKLYEEALNHLSTQRSQGIAARSLDENNICK